jgi:hypothetical protein
MNSSAWDESPRRFLRCSAAAGFERVVVYEIIWVSESLSSGSRELSFGIAQAMRGSAMISRERDEEKVISGEPSIRSCLRLGKAGVHNQPR